MNCKVCGKELDSNAKFCTECGTKVEVVKTTTKKTTKKEETVVAEPVVVPESKSKATASLVLGIISLALGAPLFMVLAIVGLILGICQKEKSGIRTAGIILNTIALVIGVITWIFIALFIVIAVVEENGPYYESREEMNGNSDIIINDDYDYNDYSDFGELNDYFDFD